MITNYLPLMLIQKILREFFYVYFRDNADVHCTVKASCQLGSARRS